MEGFSYLDLTKESLAVPGCCISKRRTLLCKSGVRIVRGGLRITAVFKRFSAELRAGETGYAAVKEHQRETALP